MFTMFTRPVSKFLACSLLGFAVTVASAMDREWTTTVSGCVAGTVTVWVTQPGGARIPFRVPVSAHANGADKAAEIAAFLRQPGEMPSFHPTAIGSTLRITCDSRFSLSFDVGNTKETTDGLKCANAQSGEAGFGGMFDPFSLPGLPATFTAGIVTDVGELSATISAQELNFQTDGPIICQALFQRLAPHAPQYGAQINYAGDRLEVYFDPAYTVTQGGVIFGTSSPTPGCYGSVIPAVAPPCPGDIDGDGAVDLTDLTMFLSAFGTQAGDAGYLADADLDGDGVIGLNDLTLFLSAYGRQC